MGKDKRGEIAQYPYRGIAQACVLKLLLLIGLPTPHRKSFLRQLKSYVQLIRDPACPNSKIPTTEIRFS